MTLTRKLWAIAAIGVFAYVAIGVLLGATPGRGTEGFGALAALIDAKADEHGRAFTAFALLIIGCVVAALGLRTGDRPVDGALHDDTGWFGGDCGGDGGD